MKYSFKGSPAGINAVSQAHSADASLRAAQAQANAQATTARMGAEGSILSTLYAQPGQFAGAMGMAGAGKSQGIGMLGAGLGSLGQGYGAAAQAMANERSNFYGANAMAESARQAGLANMGAGAIGAYGGAANNAMQTQAMQSTAYMKALSDMQAANQASAGSVGRAQTVAAALPGGGFSATGETGPIASGTYGLSGGGGGSGVIDALAAGDKLYREQLEKGFNSQAGVPRELLGDTLAGLRGLYGDAASDVNSGMSQFYASQNDPANRADYSGILAGLADTGQAITGLNRSIGDGGTGAIQRLWNTSLGGLGAFNPGKKKTRFMDFF